MLDSLKLIASQRSGLVIRAALISLAGGHWRAATRSVPVERRRDRHQGCRRLQSPDKPGERAMAINS